MFCLPGNLFLLTGESFDDTIQVYLVISFFFSSLLLVYDSTKIKLCNIILLCILFFFHVFSLKRKRLTANAQINKNFSYMKTCELLLFNNWLYLFTIHSQLLLVQFGYLFISEEEAMQPGSTKEEGRKQKHEFNRRI